MAEENSSKQVEDQQVIYVSIGIVLVVVIASIIVYSIGFAQNKQADSYQNKIDGVKQEVTKLSEAEEKAVALGIQEDEINSLYNRQTTYSQLINGLSKYAVKGVSFESATISGGDGSFNISGKAKSYLLANKQAVAFEDSGLFESINLTSATAGDKGKIDFSLEGVIK